MNSLGSILRAARGRLELSQEELAQKANVAIYTVSRLETGLTPRPQPTTLARLAVVLNLDLESLEVAAAQPTTAKQNATSTSLIRDVPATTAEKQRLDMQTEDEASTNTTAGSPETDANPDQVVA